jgi:nitrogen fixation protein FixH
VKIDIHADPNPMKTGEDNQFHVTLTDAAGKPISDARVTVTLIMPAMPAMGMPEMKSSAELAWKADSQMYEGKGHAPMTGTWTVLVEARKNSNVIASMRTHLSAK